MTLAFANTPTFYGTITVSPSTVFGARCTVWQYATLCGDVVLGDDVVVGSGVWIGEGTVIGSGTRIQHGAFIPKHTTIGVRVFIGPNVSMTDDKYPASGQVYVPQPPVLEDDCSIGAGAVLLPGVRIGRGAMVGAGAVCVQDVAPYDVVMGVPARPQSQTTGKE